MSKDKLETVVEGLRAVAVAAGVGTEQVPFRFVCFDCKTEFLSHDPGAGFNEYGECLACGSTCCLAEEVLAMVFLHRDNGGAKRGGER